MFSNVKDEASSLGLQGLWGFPACKRAGHTCGVLLSDDAHMDVK